jgi:hypothetical protein
VSPELLNAIVALDHNRLVIWVVYDHPKDYPDTFASRAFYATPEVEATAHLLFNEDVEALRADFRMAGYVRLSRAPTDDPKIVETWL